MSHGTFDALRRVGAGVFGLLRTRAEFATLELAQARERLLAWCIRGLIAAQLATLALAAGAALLAALLWPYLGPWSLLPFVLSFGGVAWWMLQRLVREIDAAPAPLAETLRQLREDQQAMSAAFGVSADATTQGHDAPPPNRPDGGAQ